MFSLVWQHRFMVVLAVGGSLFFTIYGCYVASSCAKQIPRQSSYSKLRLLLDAQGLIQNNHILASKISADDLFECAIKGMAAMDPYSHFENAQQTSLFHKKRTKNVCGIGIEIAENKDDELEVISVLPLSSAAYANILEGDILVSIDDKMVEGRGIRQCKNLIMGEKGSNICLVLRSVDGKRRTVTVQRQSLFDEDVLPAQYLKNEIALIRIGRLSKDTHKNFRRVLDEVERNNAKGIILDLRGAPGGDLDEAEKICNIFIESGKPIVKLQMHGNREGESWIMSGAGFKNLKLPMMILIDSMTASAAEIIAGALKDHGRAFIIGQPSFGKGIAQKEFLFSDGSSMWLTYARYFTPRGYSIDGRGVEPDFYVKLNADQQALARRNRRLYDDKQNAEILKGDVVLQTALGRFDLLKKHEIAPN